MKCKIASIASNLCSLTYNILAQEYYIVIIELIRRISIQMSYIDFKENQKTVIILLLVIKSENCNNITPRH
jgi:hypothetical protein